METSKHFRCRWHNPGRRAKIPSLKSIALDHPLCLCSATHFPYSSTVALSLTRPLILNLLFFWLKEQFWYKQFAYILFQFFFDNYVETARDKSKSATFTLEFKMKLNLRIVFQEDKQAVGSDMIVWRIDKLVNDLITSYSLALVILNHSEAAGPQVYVAWSISHKIATICCDWEWFHWIALHTCIPLFLFMDRIKMDWYF